MSERWVEEPAAGEPEISQLDLNDLARDNDVLINIAAGCGSAFVMAGHGRPFRKLKSQQIVATRA